VHYLIDEEIGESVDIGEEKAFKPEHVFEDDNEAEVE